MVNIQQQAQQPVETVQLVLHALILVPQVLLLAVQDTLLMLQEISKLII